MSLMQRLTDDMKTAMKAGDKSRLSAIRMLVSAVRYAGIDQGEMTDDKVISVLQREAKKRREAAEAYKAGGREEAAASEQAELAVIEEYLPKMMSEEEIRNIVNRMSDIGSKNFGDAMKMVMAECKGKADGGLVAKIVKEMFTDHK